MKRLVAVLAAVTLVTLSFGLVATPALAHETVTAGDLALELGWGTEPAYAGLPNTIQLTVTHKADGDPINDLGARLKARVTYGVETQDFDLTLTYDRRSGTGVPGEYTAMIIPTSPGDYTFHVTGRVEGVKVNLKMSSGPKTFDAVADAQAVQFPVKVPGADQVAQRLDKEVVRLNAANKAGDASSEVAGAKTIGYVGIGVGAVGVVLAAAALIWRRVA